MTDRLLPHLTRALSEHSRWLLAQGITPPAEITALVSGLAALDGLERSTRDGLPPPSDAVPVRLLDENQTAQAMGVSPRTVRRLFASGALPSVLVGRARRVHVDDLDAYLDALRGIA